MDAGSDVNSNVLFGASKDYYDPGIQNPSYALEDRSSIQVSEVSLD